MRTVSQEARQFMQRISLSEKKERIIAIYLREHFAFFV
jgi:hypothetical protein